ncbi:MAG: energy transducer TonB, partial [Saprospiraceae bacterium]
MKTNINSENLFDDIIFENRNKNYGAYQLRKTYNDHMAKAMCLTIIMIITFIVSSNILAKTKLKLNKPEVVIIPDSLIIIDIPLIPEFKNPNINQNKKFKTLEVISPRIVKDNLDIKEIKVPTVDEIRLVSIGTETSDGDTLANVTGNDQGDIFKTGTLNGSSESTFVDFAEVMPSFPGGAEKLYKYLQKNINYPNIARENRIEGTVIVGFIVSQFGEILNVEAMRKIGGG